MSRYFLPVALVTGLAAEASILRRVRETGDPMLLRMVIDLYGQVQLDATYGVPVAALSQVLLRNILPERFLKLEFMPFGRFAQ